MTTFKHLSIFFGVSMVVLGFAGCTNTTTVGSTSGADASSASSDDVPMTIQGETKTLSGAAVSTWATVAPDDTIIELGFTLPLTAVEDARVALAAGEDPQVPNPTESVSLNFPADVTGKTFVDHLEINYNPVGHPPAPIYAVPHYDFHFYGISVADQMKIDCTDKTAVPVDLFGTGFLVSKAGLPPKGECVPMMGQHAIDLASPELSRTDPQPFTKTMIRGYYAGKTNFVEPMVTREQLLSRKNFTLPVPMPATVGHATLYPTLFTATYDPATDSYRMAMTDFMEIQ